MAVMTKPNNIKPVRPNIPPVVVGLWFAFLVAFIAVSRTRYFAAFNGVNQGNSGKYFGVNFWPAITFIVVIASVLAAIPALMLKGEFLFVPWIENLIVVLALVDATALFALVRQSQRALFVFVVFGERFLSFAARANAGTIWARQGVLLSRALSHDSCIHASGCRSFYFNTVRSNA